MSNFGHSNERQRIVGVCKPGKRFCAAWSTTWISVSISRILLVLSLVFHLVAEQSAIGKDVTSVAVFESFQQKVQPLLVSHCAKCHGEEPVNNALVLTGFDSEQAILTHPEVFIHVADRIRSGDMPPKEEQPLNLGDQTILLQWIELMLETEAASRAGDPGPVALRRLSNTEYDNAIRDLTGVDMRPTEVGEFPIDSVGGEGFANVGDAMPVTPELVERYHQAAREIANRAVLLPEGFRFSHSTDRPIWTAEALENLRAFHSRYAGPGGEPPLAEHLAALVHHRDRINKGGAVEITKLASESQLNATYLKALWLGLENPDSMPVSVELQDRIQRWNQKNADLERLKQKRELAAEKIKSNWEASEKSLTVASVPEGKSIPFQNEVSVRRGELLLLTVLPNGNHGADSTLVEWTIKESGGSQRIWSVSDLIPDLLKGNSWPDHDGAQWSFLETTSTPMFLTNRRDGISGQSVLKSWSLGSEPSVFVNVSPEDLQVWTNLPARSFFVHPGPARPVAVAWTSPVTADLVVSGRVADVHPAGLDGVSFELSHLAEPELGQALADVGDVSFDLPEAEPHPAPLEFVREKWRATKTDLTPLLDAIQKTQGQLFRSNYGKHAVIAVGNGFPAWEELGRVVAEEPVEGVAREPVFRLVSLPAEPDTYVIWDRLRLEGGDGDLLLFSDHPELRAAVEQACGIRFGEHPLNRPVPQSALVTQAGEELIIDLSGLPPSLLELLRLPRFLRSEVMLDERSPESAEVQAFLIAATGGGGRLAEPVAMATQGDTRVAKIVHPAIASQVARSATEFRKLFPPAVLFEPIIPRDAQGSLFLYHREDTALRELLLNDDEILELNRLWSQLDFVSEQAFVTPRMYEEILQYYRDPNDGARIMFFYIQLLRDRIMRERELLAEAKVQSESSHLDALLEFARKAWRRPVTDEEVEVILASYRADRAEGTEHDGAFRAALTRILSSPWFLYRVEQPAKGPHWQPVSASELATRLSFLLWDSIPDEPLSAEAEELHKREVMEAQVRRMLKDDRVRGMALEFGARWLGVRDFDTGHGRNLQQFPEFTIELRDALAEEPVQFFMDQLSNNRPVADLVDSEAIVINQTLAKHYEIPWEAESRGTSIGPGSEWRRFENASHYSRGGLLGLGAVLAKTAAASRTSPVKRGAWVVELLGDRLPPTPPGVPPLPETPPDGLSVREITERHRKDPACANCHLRIDPFGMPLEQFDALGRLRPSVEFKPGDIKSVTRDGVEINGFAGLKEYLAVHRRGDVFSSLARKLTGYALGRSVMLSDRELVNQISESIASGACWSEVLLMIAQSDQFRSVRPSEVPGGN